MNAETGGTGLRVIAVFDFDGTLTRRDTSLPFVFFVLGKARGWWRILQLVPAFAADGLAAWWHEGIASGRRADTKLGGVLGRWECSVHERILRRCLGGMPVARLRELGERFMAANAHVLIRSAGLRRLQWHKEHGHRCVLISASIRLYLDRWAREAGFDDVLGTELEADAEGLFTGRFATEPCWGRAKVRRLRAHVGSLEGLTIYAYGDSVGDRDLLEIADHGFLVRGDLGFGE